MRIGEPHPMEDAKITLKANGRREPARDGAPLWYAALAVLVCFFAVPLIPFIFPLLRWPLAGLFYVTKYIALLGWGFLIALVLKCVTAMIHSTRHDGVTHPRKGRVARRWVGVAGVAGLSIGSEAAVHFAATDIHQHWEQRFPPWWISTRTTTLRCWWGRRSRS